MSSIMLNINSEKDRGATNGISVSPFLFGNDPKGTMRKYLEIPRVLPREWNSISKHNWFITVQLLNYYGCTGTVRKVALAI